MADMTERHEKLQAGSLEEEVPRDNPLQIHDLTMRDGHQSLFATRCRTEDLVPIAERMDAVGFFAVEVWGGATFDAMHRFLAEDPWERIRVLKRHMPRTPFSMLLRGQNLVGYRHYADDVAKAFTERCCVNGIDVFRVFDALNDFRNFQTVVQVIKEQGKHFQGAICYSLTERKMGGPVYTLDYYLDKATELEDMGADTICIKDMAGLIAPYDAFRLIRALKERISVPIHLHSHFTSGMADMAMLKAVEAGVDIIDVCLSPWAYRTSHPGLEPLVVALQDTSRDTGFDLEELTACAEHFNDISPKYRHLLDDRMSIIDTNVLLHQTPGGMLSNLVNQLREMGSLDKLQDVFKELPRVRKELGQVPLVTPTSQIVGIQTVNNVLFDTPEERYKMITSQVKDLCFGLYGQPPAPIDPEVQQKAIKDHPRGDEPFTGRPADILEPELDKAKKDTEGLAKDIDDVLIYALYPTTGKRFLRWKHGFEEVPDTVKPRSMEDVERERELVAKAKKGELVEPSKSAPGVPKSREGFINYEVFVNDDFYQVQIKKDDQGSSQVASVTHGPSQPSAAAGTGEPPAAAEPSGDTVPVEAPLTGIVIEYKVQENDRVAEGDVLLTLEAMKMENSITAPSSGTVKDIAYKPGDGVNKGDVLLVLA
jgi:pyruvate carboxylase subunit B